MPLKEQHKMLRNSSKKLEAVCILALSLSPSLIHKHILIVQFRQFYILILVLKGSEVWI